MAKTKITENSLEYKKQTYVKVLEFFFSFPSRSVGLNDLSKAISSSKSATKSVVDRLVEQGFLEKQELGKAWVLRAVPANKDRLAYKLPSVVETIYRTHILELILQKYPSYRCIVLFGSYRWADDDEHSDIDIAVEVMDNHPPRTEQLGTLDTLWYRKNIPVNLFVFCRNQVDLNVFTNIANGIVLDGLLEVRP